MEVRETVKFGRQFAVTIFMKMEFMLWYFSVVAAFSPKGRLLNVIWGSNWSGHTICTTCTTCVWSCHCCCKCGHMCTVCYTKIDTRTLVLAHTDTHARGLFTRAQCTNTNVRPQNLTGEQNKNMVCLSSLQRAWREMAIILLEFHAGNPVQSSKQ